MQQNAGCGLKLLNLIACYASEKVCEPLLECVHQRMERSSNPGDGHVINASGIAMAPDCLAENGLYT